MSGGRFSSSQYAGCAKRETKIRDENETAVRGERQRDQIFNNLNRTCQMSYCKKRKRKMAGIKEAKLLAIEAHKNQCKKDGITPYIKHPLSVASRAKSEEEIMVALLHDIIEDTYITYDDLKEKGFSEEVINAVESITHLEEESYLRYIAKVCENPLARRVKILDILDNISDKPAMKQIHKYGKALAMLTENFDKEVI